MNTIFVLHFFCHLVDARCPNVFINTISFWYFGHERSYQNKLRHCFQSNVNIPQINRLISNAVTGMSNMIFLTLPSQFCPCIFPDGGWTKCAILASENFVLTMKLHCVDFLLALFPFSVSKTLFTKNRTATYI